MPLADEALQNTQGRRIHVRIWLLAACGLCAGVVILGLFARHVSLLRHSTAEFHRQQHAIHSIREDLMQPASALDQSLASVFQANVPAEELDARMPKVLVEARQRALGSRLRRPVTQAILEITTRLERSRLHLEACIAWRRQLDNLQIERQAIAKQTGNAAQALLDRVEGIVRERQRQRLQGLSDPSASNERIRELALRISKAPDLAPLKERIRSLRQLTKGLEGERHTDILIELRDRRAPFLIQSIREQLERGRSDLPGREFDDLNRVVDGLSRWLLGRQSGTGRREGLIATHISWLRTTERGRSLEDTARKQRSDVQQALASLEHSLDRTSMDEITQLQRGLDNVWNASLWTSLIAGLLFLIMARTVSFSAKQQVHDLRFARQEADAAVRAQSAFLANMSHEIRTPMNGVLGMAEVLEESQLTVEQQQLVNTVKSSAEALLTVINDVLDFSKIESGKLELELRDFDLRETIEDSLELLSHTAAAKHIELLHSFDPSLPSKVRGDPTRLRQILLNLTGNAVKFTPEGVVEISVECMETVDQALMIEIAIRDTGIGISPSALTKLFRPFSQADASTTRQFGGTGLGLTISKRLVQLMQGTIRVESIVDVGTTFTIAIRLAPAQGATRIWPNTFDDDRVLLVDCSDPMAASLATRLAPLYVGFEAVTNTADALEVLRLPPEDHARPSLVLIRCGHESLDALDLARSIRAEDGANQPKVALIGLPSDRPHDDDLQKAGVDTWLSEPVRDQALLGILTANREPLQQADHPATESESSPPENQLDLHVLVAEDNEINRKVVERMLGKLGCTFEFSHDGRDAIERATAESFDLILMDCQMPRVDGFGATRAIRKQPGPNQNTPIIALTANALATDRQACLAAGMDDFLAKPIKRAQLGTTLANWAGRSSIALVTDRE